MAGRPQSDAGAQAAGSVPGPGAYDGSPSRRDGPAFSIGGKWRGSADTAAEAPGPGEYGSQAGCGRGGPAFTMGSRHRSPDAMRVAETPGGPARWSVCMLRPHAKHLAVLPPGRQRALCMTDGCHLLWPQAPGSMQAAAMRAPAGRRSPSVLATALAAVAAGTCRRGRAISTATSPHPAPAPRTPSARATAHWTARGLQIRQVGGAVRPPGTLLPRCHPARCSAARQAHSCCRLLQAQGSMWPAAQQGPWARRSASARGTALAAATAERCRPAQDTTTATGAGPPWVLPPPSQSAPGQQLPQRREPGQQTRSPLAQAPTMAPAAQGQQGLPSAWGHGSRSGLQLRLAWARGRTRCRRQRAAGQHSASPAAGAPLRLGLPLGRRTCQVRAAFWASAISCQRPRNAAAMAAQHAGPTCASRPPRRPRRVPARPPGQLLGARLDHGHQALRRRQAAGWQPGRAAARAPRARRAGASSRWSRRAAAGRPRQAAARQPPGGARRLHSRPLGRSAAQHSTACTTSSLRRPCPAPDPDSTPPRPPLPCPARQVLDLLQRLPDELLRDPATAAQLFRGVRALASGAPPSAAGPGSSPRLQAALDSWGKLGGRPGGSGHHHGSGHHGSGHHGSGSGGAAVRPSRPAYEGREGRGYGAGGILRAADEAGIRAARRVSFADEVGEQLLHVRSLVG
jgi:hypothetical protein